MFLYSRRVVVDVDVDVDVLQCCRQKKSFTNAHIVTYGYLPRKRRREGRMTAKMKMKPQREIDAIMVKQSISLTWAITVYLYI